MEFVSIGPYCESAIIIKNCDLRNNSYPFDYIFSSLDFVNHAIKDRFKIFLDKQYHKNGNVYDTGISTLHTFYSQFLDTEILRKHHIVHGLPEKAKNLKNHEVFVHHNLLDENIYNAFERRCNRLLNLIDNNKKIVFVYYNCYTLEYDDLIDFSNSFNNYKNIFIVGIFKNSLEKKILYENTNCKIYQNYDNRFIFDEIKNNY